jgi:hypothetical protein
VVPVTEVPTIPYLLGAAVVAVIAGAVIAPLFLYGMFAGDAPARGTPTPAPGPRESAA